MIIVNCNVAFYNTMELAVETNGLSNFEITRKALFNYNKNCFVNSDSAISDCSSHTIFYGGIGIVCEAYGEAVFNLRDFARTANGATTVVFVEFDLVILIQVRKVRDGHILRAAGCLNNCDRFVAATAGTQGHTQNEH